uniref:Cystatin-B n=1 Tax=Oreochromis aureus TaxID=47969 RepID=A0A668RBA7_OREAU
EVSFFPSSTCPLYCVRSQAEQKTNKKYVEFLALKYRSQVVAGTNYLIKVLAGGTSYLHLLVWRKLPFEGGNAVLTRVQEHHHKDDPLLPF